MKSVLIIANGEAPDDKILMNLVKQSDLVVAADGGSNICYEKNIHPDFIIGDLDSIQPQTLAHFKDCEIVKISDQNTHDLKKAVNFCLTLKPDLIRITAALGKRTDHSLANLLILQEYISISKIQFYDNFGVLSMITGEQYLKIPVGKLVSLFSFMPVSGLTISGLKYSLNEVDYPNGFNGLSNVTDHEEVSIKIKKGSLFIYVANECDKS